MDAEFLAQVEAAEERLRLAMLFSNTRALDELLSNELTFTDHFGHVLGKADELAAHQSGALSLMDLAPSEQHIQLLSGGGVVSVLMHVLGRHQGQPINQHLRYTRVWAVEEDGALRVIAGHASELRAAPAIQAAQPSAGPSGLRITGQVTWNGRPVAGARLELKEAEDGRSPALAEANTGVDGWFVLENPPAGKFMLWAYGPADQYAGGRGCPLTIGAGQAIRAPRIELAKPLELLEPPVGATLAGDSVVLRWQSFPRTARYHVDIFDNANGEAVLRQDTPDTQLRVAPALAPGRLYQWSVSAYNAAHQPIADSAGWLFEAQA